MIVGGRRTSGLGDGGAARDARLNKPNDVSVSWWSLYDESSPKAFIADTGHNRIRVFDAFGPTPIRVDATEEPGADSEIESLVIPRNLPLYDHYSDSETSKPFGSLRGPKGVAAAYDNGDEGLVFVADTGNSRVVGIWYEWINNDADDALEPVAQEAFSIRAPGMNWSLPQSIAVDACSEVVYVADTGRDRIVGFDGWGSWDLQVPGLKHPVGVATNGMAAAYSGLFGAPTDLSSEVYVADDQAGKVFAVDLWPGLGCFGEYTATGTGVDVGNVASGFAGGFRRGAAVAQSVRPHLVSEGPAVTVLPVGGRPVAVESDGLGGVYVSQALTKKVVHWMPEDVYGEIGSLSDTVPGGIVSKIDHYAGPQDVCDGLPATAVLSQLNLTPPSMQGDPLGAPAGLEIVPLGLLYYYFGGGLPGFGIFDAEAQAELPLGYVLNDVWFADSVMNVIGARTDIGNDAGLPCLGESSNL